MHAVPPVIPCLPMASGQIRVRMPVGLHEALIREAARQGVSMNTLIVTLLAGGLGYTQSPKEEDSDA